MHFCLRWGRKKRAGTDTWCGQSAADLPYKKLGPLEADVFASYSGPDKGLAWVYHLENLENGQFDVKVSIVLATYLLVAYHYHDYIAYI